MNISHAVQGNEINISNQFLAHYINGILFCALNILAHMPLYNVFILARSS